MEHKSRRPEAPTYTVDQPTTLLPFLLSSVKGKSRNNVKSLLSRRLVAVDGVPVSLIYFPTVLPLTLSPFCRIFAAILGAP